MWTNIAIGSMVHSVRCLRFSIEGRFVVDFEARARCQETYHNAAAGLALSRFGEVRRVGG